MSRPCGGWGIPLSSGKNRQRKLSVTLWMGYILALLAWAGGVAGAALLAYFICASRSWGGSEPLYPMIHWAHQNVLLLGIVLTLGGWLVISYFFIARPVRYLNELVNAAEKLARPGEDPIILSAAMKETEAQLNLFRERALRDAMAAREAEQRKNDLIVYLAHDLKTPLTSVIGYLTLLRDEPDLSPALRSRYTGVALDKAERLEDLINEFFDITRFNLTHLELEKRPVDLTRMLQQVASEFAPMLEEAGLTCRLFLPEKLLYPCDPDKLARVFDNLLRNACHYSTPGTEVRIAAEAGEDGLSLTFANTGVTIPPEKLGRIFEQFFRLDSSRASGTGGAGLGLAIAKEIVQLHSGTITAQSEDGVTTFTVCLPNL